ncbi:hypothetical protein EZV62_014759 [Acer yangbiense]|uniref:Glycosyltransferase n=1 Tax=Acer yangbiense TaxID=1000413 RepID=A0A5C7HV73_9ROSI|nr:hypothetical protein EZV62_014759 [Acer yangbiense]
MGSLNKPHAVLVPYPAQGHINPLMQLAKLLHLRGFYITFVNTEFNHKRLIRSKGLNYVRGQPDFRFETIPDGLPPSDIDATQDLWTLSDSVQRNCLSPFRQVLAKLSSCSECPPVTCIISDGLMTFTMKAAEELGIQEVQFYTTSACGFMAYLCFGELINRGLVPFKDENFLINGSLETPIDWIPGMRNFRLKDFPTLIRTADPNDILLNFMKEETQNCLNSSAIILNTFDEFEHEIIQAIAAKFPRNIYTIGPLSLLETGITTGSCQSGKSSLWKEDSKCLKWLDKREPNSVVFVSFGSITVMSEKCFIEFAWGLANSKHPFLWVVRPDLVKGSSIKLPEEYFEEIKDRGSIVSWCPQEKVLSHPSIGVFLTHCGWNSTLESICGGVPLICWPFFDEQPTNCRYSCTVWGIGMEVNHVVKCDEVEALIKEMMEGDKGKQMKKNALEWKKKAQVATSIGGSSYHNFNRFIKDVLYGCK